MFSSFCSSSHQKIIVELGIGDGRLLKKLLQAGNNTDRTTVRTKGTTYIGIELDNSNYNKAKSTLQEFNNVTLMKGSFEVLIHDFSDGSIDEIIFVLPDPDFIDVKKQYKWQNFYGVINRKLSRNGRFRLVTELIDELLRPVSDEELDIWVHWVVDTFQQLGFSPTRIVEGPPFGYESECLERFMADPERIRLTTFDFIKR